jgi:tetraacyldisaccharide 4'-kinase
MYPQRRGFRVPPEEPSWWYATDGSGQLTKRLLEPAAWLYARMAQRRFAKIESYRARVPVICVGNFTAGGTGKTPLAQLIAAHLTAAGRRPVVLSRGYGGANKGPELVRPTQHRAAEVGDEPLLLAQTVPVVIARDRAAGVRFIEDLADTPDVIVMDDGLQNPAVHQDLTIALVDGARGVGNGAVIPAGPLRAPIEFQFGLADAIVVNGRGPVGRETSVRDTLRRQFPGPVLEAQVAPAGDTAWLAQKPVLAYSGIGHPARFFAGLEALDARIVDRRTFGDHHQFKEREARDLLAAADAQGAQLVTTQKDWVRLSGEGGALSALQERSRVLEIRLAFEAQDEDRLFGLIAAAVKMGGERPSDGQA